MPTQATGDNQTIPQAALFELRHIVIASGTEALWVYRDPRVIGRKLLVSLQDAGYIVACDDGQEWTRDCYRATEAGRAIAAEAEG